MSLFGRDLAPISKAALAEIDAQAARTIRAQLSVRRFADISGPHGLEFSAVSLGRMQEEKCDVKDVCMGVRTVLPLAESRISFNLDQWELHNIDRGVKDPDLSDLEAAAEKIAALEEHILYHGHAKAGIKGLVASCENKAVDLSAKDTEKFTGALQAAIVKMKVKDGIGGPYALVGGAKLHAALGRIDGNRTLYSAVKKFTEVDEIIYSPHYDGAFLVSKRGGDFELTLGFDYTVGYNCAKGKQLEFFIGESFTFQIIEPRAYTPLVLK